MSESSPKKPDYNLSAMDASNVCKGRVGAAWINEDGSINIRLNPFVVLDAMDDLKLRLFPFREWPEAEPAEMKKFKRNPKKDEEAAERRGDEPDDGIPF